MIDQSLIGVASEPVELTWDTSDAILYALGVGAGLDNPLAELELTTENSQDVGPRALPTFAIVLAQSEPQRQQRRLGDFDPAQLVHAEQAITLQRPLAASGRIRVNSWVSEIYDKGSGALVVVQSEGLDPADGGVVFTERSASFIRGEGGFGGERGPAEQWQAPDREPDHTATYPTLPGQALLYRLSGDRNPLHSDPRFATQAGFDRPILHGLCTYGFAARALLHAVGGSDPARLRSMSGRFTAPVYPGDSLTARIWREETEVLFQMLTANRTTVIDRGRAVFS
jgi:acyl dehydratase